MLPALVLAHQSSARPSGTEGGNSWPSTGTISNDRPHDVPDFVIWPACPGSGERVEGLCLLGSDKDSGSQGDLIEVLHSFVATVGQTSEFLAV